MKSTGESSVSVVTVRWLLMSRANGNARMGELRDPIPAALFSGRLITTIS